MALTNQIQVYSLDTGSFYTDYEREIDLKIIRMRALRKKIAEKNMVNYSQVLRFSYGVQNFMNFSELFERQVLRDAETSLT